MDVNAYARQLKQLLPRGIVWNLEAGSRVSQVMLALAEELARVDARGADLVEESDPRTASETLDAWESMLGLPDDVILTIPATVAERRLAVTQKLLRVGGQTPAFYIALAAASGYAVTIDDSYGLTVARAGRARAGDPVRGVAWAHAWMVTVSPPAGAALTTTELEAIIRRAAPSHTAVLFTYL